jgi:hypothetical protein
VNVSLFTFTVELGTTEEKILRKAPISALENRMKSSSRIHSPLLGDKVVYGIGLSYRPASLYVA